MKNVFLFVFSVLLLSACKKDSGLPDGGVVYYKFTAAEMVQIPQYQENDTLVFKNQSGDSMFLWMVQASLSLKTRCAQGIGFFGPHAATYFFYDAIHYRSYIVGTTIEISFDFEKWPLQIDSAKADIKKLFPAAFTTNIVFNGVRHAKIPDVAGPLNKGMQAGNIFYPNVAKIANPNPDTNYSYKIAHTLYYAYKDGLIGFDDWQGNEWRLFQKR